MEGRRNRDIGGVVMGRTKAVGVGLAASLALSLCLASGASAALPLFLKHEGKILVAGATVDAGVIVTIGGNGCFEFFGGKLSTNGKPKDKAGFTEVFPQECTSGYSLTGLAKTVEVTSKGQYVIKASPKLALTTPGPCVYEASKLQGTFPVPGPVVTASLSGTAKLNKKLSNGTCAKAATMGSEANLTTEVLGAALDAET
jgi:hypothetical protein